jgi:hypothetical protein
MRSVIQHGNGLQTQVILQDGNLVTGTVQDCTPIAEFTKAAHNVGAHGSSEFRHAAKIPLVIIEQYCNIKGITLAEFWQNSDHVKAILNDPDLKDFRIWPGRV